MIDDDLGRCGLRKPYGCHPEIRTAHCKTCPLLEGATRTSELWAWPLGEERT
jgi:hypothetical protein